MNIEFYKLDREKVSKACCGEYWGELLHHGDGYSAHLAINHNKTEGLGKRLSTPGSDDIVIEGISKKGWEKLLNDLGDLSQAKTVKNRIAELPYLAKDKVLSGK